MNDYRIRLKIVDIVIEIRSRFRMLPPEISHGRRDVHFIYNGKEKSEIILDVEMRNRLLKRDKGKRIFATFDPIKHRLRWRLFKKGDGYLIEQYTSGKRQFSVLNKNLNKGVVYISYKKNKRIWKLEDIVYDLLQIILISYLSKKDGLFVHSFGLRDIDGKGLLFVGQSKSGKSTSARIWHGNSDANIFSDDRIILKKIEQEFFIFSSPWHGDFNAYVKHNEDRALLKKIFFIRHSPKNIAYRLNPKEAFEALYPNIFPTFWDRDSMKKQIKLCHELVARKKAYKLGFKKDKSIISYIRSIG
ncbi:MAG: hypothetical protein A2987_04065 [Omnitrophica bacterium RIFCSPLOWO2_01_FULL_45_10]|nr:MAG: hypothetical protein A2987_04065 [Omnitrophica bacterium RIFCSPLOWO2_01_FULL_45_10]